MTDPIVQNICEKSTLWGIMFYKYLLWLYVFISLQKVRVSNYIHSVLVINMMSYFLCQSWDKGYFHHTLDDLLHCVAVWMSHKINLSIFSSVLVKAFIPVGLSTLRWHQIDNACTENLGWFWPESVPILVKRHTEFVFSRHRHRFFSVQIIVLDRFFQLLGSRWVGSRRLCMKF